MSDLIAITPERIGWLIWLVWAAIGVVAGIISSRYVGPRTTIFCIIIEGNTRSNNIVRKQCTDVPLARINGNSPQHANYKCAIHQDC